MCIIIIIMFSSPPHTSATSILRQHKPSPGGKRVRFDVVTVYYFPRRQGFTSVPSQGGSSLGMARHHSSIRHYTLGEFAREQETSHRHTLRQHLRQEKLNARKMKVRFTFHHVLYLTAEVTGYCSDCTSRSFFWSCDPHQKTPCSWASRQPSHGL